MLLNIICINFITLLWYFPSSAKFSGFSQRFIFLSRLLQFLNN